jgi:beta-barrel assembly-enhancing protease
MRLFQRLSLALALSLSAACATNPVTGESELSLVSEQQEITLGSQQYGPSQQSQGGQYVLDPVLQAYIAEIGHKLAAVSHRPDLPYEFVVLNNPVPNAWALPGGKIAINRGLLLELNNEAELAAVIGHEIVHAAARHGASQMSRGQLANITTGIATIAAATVGYGQVGAAASQMGSAAFMASYGRGDELEADRYGMDYMASIGYDPQAAVSLQETFVRLSDGQQTDFLSGLFASHPPSQERVDANRKRAATLPGGELFRDRYLEHIALLKHDAPAYQKQKEAQAALKEEKPDQALALLEQALAIQPNEGSFWETRGHAWHQKKDLDKAEQSYTTAIQKTPNYFSPLLYRGMLRQQENNYAQAQTDLLASHALLPNPASAFYLGESYVAVGDTETAVQYYKQAAGSQGELGQLAQYKLAVLDLAQNPNKYISSRAYLGNDGYIKVAIKNDTPVTVGGITVQLLEMQDRYNASRQIPLQGKHQLNAGQRKDLPTKIGPFSGDAEAGDWRSDVVTAKVVENL